MGYGETWRLLRGSSEYRAGGALLSGLGLWFVCFLLGWPAAVAQAKSAPVLFLLAASVWARRRAGGPQLAMEEKKSLKGHVVIVTGAGGGIGAATAVELARLEATVILGARGGAAKLREILSTARTAVGDKRADLHAIELDLSSFESIKAFAATVRKQHSKVNILVCNAGVALCPLSFTKNGLELQMGTNHFGHFLLTSLLHPTLAQAAKEDGESRLVCVSSVGHAIVDKIQYPNLSNKDKYDPMKAYADSKLANILFASEYERRYGSAGMHAYSLHPGTVQSSLQRHVNSAVQIIMAPISWAVYKTAEQGAQCSLFCAMSPNAVPGAYHQDLKPVQPSPAARDAEAAKAWWETSEAITGVQFPK